MTKITIVGLGLIGGSMAMDLRKHGLCSSIIGVDSSKTHAERALERGLVDGILPLREAVQCADVVIVAVPVDTTLKLLPRILDLAEQKVVFDVASTKSTIIDAIALHPFRARFVATHPMAGTEFSGPDAAIEDLFREKNVIFCDSEKSAPDALSVVKNLYSAFGMQIEEMPSDMHDQHAAYVSHISHVTSFALALSVLDKEQYDESNILRMAAGGFRSTVRLAKSNPDTWVPIFLQNAANVQTVLDNYVEKLMLFRQHLRKRDAVALHAYISEANRIEDILTKMKG